MWALIDKETKIVKSCIVGIPYEQALKNAKNNILIEMTLENSPATIGDLWNGKSFIDIQGGRA